MFLLGTLEYLKMPTYDYYCGSCEHTFEEQLLIKDRNKPTKKPCPKCGKKDIRKLVGAPGIGDAVSLGRKKIDNGFREVLSKIEEKTGQQVQRKFD